MIALTDAQITSLIDVYKKVVANPSEGDEGVSEVMSIISSPEASASSAKPDTNLWKDNTVCWSVELPVHDITLDELIAKSVAIAIFEYYFECLPYFFLKSLIACLAAINSLSKFLSSVGISTPLGFNLFHNSGGISPFST